MLQDSKLSTSLSGLFPYIKLEVGSLSNQCISEVVAHYSYELEF